MGVVPSLEPADLPATRSGRHDTLDEFLAHLDASGPICVFRVNSGLKLFQFGLELANVGILSVFGRERATVEGLSRRLGEIRTLLDSGLRFADVAALEFPAFLNPAATLEYETAIFQHNYWLGRWLTTTAFFSQFPILRWPTAGWVRLTACSD